MIKIGTHRIRLSCIGIGSKQGRCMKRSFSRILLHSEVLPAVFAAQIHPYFLITANNYASKSSIDILF